MKKMRRWVLATLLAGVLVLVIGAQYWEKEANAAGQRMEGSWIANVSQPGFPPFQRIFTFTGDGAFLIADNLQAAPMGVELFTTAHGEWIRTGHGEFAVTAVGQRYGLQGNLVGTYKVRGNLQLSRGLSEWGGSFRIDIINLGGQVIFSSATMIHATRIEVELLE